MAAVPSIGRADRDAPREAELTRALYERHAGQIYRYCLHRLGSREEAEDAVQSTFLNAFRGIKRGIVPERETAWLFKIAENVCLSRRRSSWRRERIESPAGFELAGEHATAPSRLADELVRLQDVLEHMPESQRRAILLREWQGLSYREIADELELSQTAVETLIFRARRSLAKGLEAPPQPARARRIARGADLGNVVAVLKSLLLGGGAAAAKAAAVVAVVGAGTVVATAPPTHRHVSVPPPARVVHRAAVVPAVRAVVPAPPVTVKHVAPKPQRRPTHLPVAEAPPPPVAPAPAPPAPTAQTQGAPPPVVDPPTHAPPSGPAPPVSSAPIAPDSTPDATTAPTAAATTPAPAPPAVPPAAGDPAPPPAPADHGSGNGNGSGNADGHGGGDHQDGGTGPHGHGH